MVHIIFQQGDLDYYEMTPAHLDEATLRKCYRARTLRVHPDKTDGSTKAFLEAQAVYDRLRYGLRHFHELQLTGKVTSIYECVSYKPSRSGRCKNLLHLEDIRLAPTWYPQRLLEQSWYSPDSVQHALLDLSWSFAMPLCQLVESLCCLKPGEYFSARCSSGAAEHTDDTSWSFHGTSFTAMHAIMLEGFLGVFGAGRFAAVKKFGVDMPVVYVSPLYECAARYPLALATPQGEPLGEYVADDVCPLRVVLQCFAPLSKRRIKIRGSKTNHQDAYLPEDVSVHSVIFVACGAAPACQGWADRAGEPIDGVGATEHDDSDDVADVAATNYYENEFARDDDVDGGTLEHQVHSMLVRLRIHVRDPRTALAVADDMLDLLDLRQQFCAQHQIEHRSLSQEEFNTLWQGPFRDLFFEDERGYWAELRGMVQKKARTNSRFYAWVRRRYGKRPMFDHFYALVHH